MHDIGKIGIPESILFKPGSLSKDERDVVQMHPNRGEEIVRPLNLPQECLDGIKYHHEHYDGNGYPYGLKAEEIPLGAAIIAVADAFDAMITDRPYRKGLSRQCAIDELRRCSGTQFDPAVVEAAIVVFTTGLV